MSDHWFDTAVATHDWAPTRRGLLAVPAAMGIFRAPRRAAAGAVRAAACLGKGERCKQKRYCCSERCAKKGQKRGRCACSPEGARCVVSADCCRSAETLICVLGRCVT